MILDFRGSLLPLRHEFRHGVVEPHAGVVKRHGERHSADDRLGQGSRTVLVGHGSAVGVPLIDKPVIADHEEIQRLPRARSPFSAWSFASDMPCSSGVLRRQSNPDVDWPLVVAPAKKTSRNSRQSSRNMKPCHDAAPPRSSGSSTMLDEARKHQPLALRAMRRWTGDRVHAHRSNRHCGIAPTFATNILTGGARGTYEPCLNISLCISHTEKSLRHAHERAFAYCLNTSTIRPAPPAREDPHRRQSRLHRHRALE